MASKCWYWPQGRDMIQSRPIQAQGEKRINNDVEKTQLPLHDYSYIKRLESLLYCAKDPPTPQNLLEVCNLACKIIFTTPSSKLEDVETCSTWINAFYRKTKEGSGGGEVLDQVLVEVFAQKLCERFTYKKRLCDLLNDRHIPEEKKEKWLLRQYEVQEKRYKETDDRSITFLVGLFDRPLFVYRVLEKLLKLANPEAVLYDFINEILRIFSMCRISCLTLSRIKQQQELGYFHRVRKLAEKNDRVPLLTRKLVAEHKGRFVICRCRQKDCLYNKRSQ